MRLMPFGEFLELDRLRAVDALEPEILLGECSLDLLAEDLRLQQILDADAEPEGLVSVRGADPAACGADLELAEPPLACPVDRAVPGHHHVRVARKPHAIRRHAARLQLVQLDDEVFWIDDATGADHAFLPGDDPGRQVPQLEGLTGNDDRVTGVRAAVVAADEVRVLGEQVDDLALALVAPLRPDDHDRGHRRSLPPGEEPDPCYPLRMLETI